MSFDDEPEATEEAEEAEDPPISVDAVFDALRREGSTSFSVVSAAKKGNVWMARDFTTFRDIDRLARLLPGCRPGSRRKAGAVGMNATPRSS